MMMPGRSFSATSGYRYGFNGKENDNEVSGQGNQYDYGFRIYNPRLGRFLSVDPLFKGYPWYTPYQFAGNMPIWAVDLDGLEEKKATQVDIYRVFEWGKQVAEHNDGRGRIYKSSVTVTSQGEEGGGYMIRYHDFNFGSPGSTYINASEYREFQTKAPDGIPSMKPIAPAPIAQTPPKTNLTQENDDVPVTGIPQTTTVISPINNRQVQNQTITRNINFVSGQPQFASDADRQTVNQVAASAPNGRTSSNRTTTNGNTTTRTTTTRTVRSIITIDLKTDLSDTQYGQNLLNNRYNLLRQQLVNAGVPANNIRRGTTQFDSPAAASTPTGNQTIFRVQTTRTTRTTGTATTTTTQ